MPISLPVTPTIPAVVSTGQVITSTHMNMVRQAEADLWTDVQALAAGAQTPWTQNVDGGGFTLAHISALGIGTSTPLVPLHIRVGPSGVTPLADSTRLFIENQNAAAYVEVATASATQSTGYLFSSGTSITSYIIDINSQWQFVSAARPAIFNIGGAERLRINPGSVNVGTINVAPVAGYPLTVNAGRPGCILYFGADEDYLPRIKSESHLGLQSPVGADILFYAGGNIERMRVTAAGSVSVLYTLNVAGSANLLGTAYVTGPALATTADMKYYLQIVTNSGNHDQLVFKATRAVAGATWATNEWSIERVIDAATSAGYIAWDVAQGYYGRIRIGSAGSDYLRIGPAEVRSMLRIEGAFELGYLSNTYHDGANWRYRATGPCNIMLTEAFAPLRVFAAAPGAAAAVVATLTNVLSITNELAFRSHTQTLLQAVAVNDLADAAQWQWYTVPVSNTQLSFRMKGSDGVWRQATLTLA